MKKRLHVLFSGMAALMLLTGCGATPASKTESEPTDNTASQEETQDGEGEAQPLNITYHCSTYNSDGTQITSPDGYGIFVEYSSLEEAQTSDKLLHCEGKYESGDLSETDKKAVQEANYSKEDNIGLLYGTCATTIGYPIDNRGTPFNQEGNPLVNAKQANEALAALILCPNHPDADKIRQNAQNAIQKDQQEQAKKHNGEILDDGTYTVGTQIQPGTWKTSTERVENCYWELRDGDGNIQNNDFIESAPNVTVEIPSTAASFTSKSCGTWTKQ